MSRAYEAHAGSISNEEPSSLWRESTPMGEVLEDGFSTVIHGRIGLEKKKGAAAQVEDQPDEPLADFTLLGIRKSVRVALHEAFPNIRTPTACQTAFIPAIMSRKDVMLKDSTGTGKSFGLVLALLSKTRATRPHMPYKERIALAKRPITSIVAVPHRDLAYQLMHWIRMLCPHNAQGSLDSIAQVCVRGDAFSPLPVQLKKLREQAPHILIGTPQALVEILEKDKAALQIPTLETVVVDEVDYLIPFPPPGASKKLKWKWDTHPPPTMTLLNALFEDRSKLQRQESSMPWRWPLQTVFTSATLPHHLKRFFIGQTNWMDKYSEVIKIDFEKEGRQSGVGEVNHYALVVDRVGGVRNLKLHENEEDEGEQEERYEDKTTPSSSNNSSRSVSPAILEAVAMTFALDVPKSALLVLPAAAPVKSVLDELHQLGINARSLGLQDEDRGKQELMRSTLKKFNRVQKERKTNGNEDEGDAPSLLVSTEASIRGLDLPELSHVFVVGVLESEVEYNHAAGRVGRFGRHGKVVVFLEASGEHKLIKESRRAKPERVDGEERLRRMYTKLGISPSQFEHIQI